MKNIAVLIFLISTIAMNAQNSTLEPLVNVSGEGKTKAIPDGVDIRVRVESKGREAQTVKAENDRVINDVIKFLRTQGIDGKYVQTERINLNKNYDYNAKVYSYVANQTLTIKLKDINSYEGVMTGLLSSGINRIEGVQFTASTMDALRSEARVKAITNAKAKAEAYAKALGQSIGHAVQITESGSVNPQPPLYKAARALSIESDSGGGETIAPGELTYTARVSVSFRLLQK